MGVAEFGSWCWGLRHHLRYNTVQIVSIKNFKLCLMHFFLQLVILLYIILYVIVIKKGYQSFSEVAGTSMIKVKGSAFNNGTLPWVDPADVPINYRQVYDSTDLVYPSMERDASFLTTNLWVTPNQTRSECYPGSNDWYNTVIPASVPDHNKACGDFCVRGTVKGELDTQTGGVWTGGFELMPNVTNPANSNCYCQLYTWCPDENVDEDPPVDDEFHLVGVDNFTISVRQNIQFHKFGVVTSNVRPKDNNVPPIWTLGQMLDGAGGMKFEQIRRWGAVIVVSAEWTCNLDFTLDSCNPIYSFVPLGKSFNFRRVEFSNGIYSTRQLIKHLGVRLLVVLSGSGGKFDAAALFTNIGAGIGLLAVASLLADFAAVNLLGHKALYEKAKFKHVEVREDGSMLNDDGVPDARDGAQGGVGGTGVIGGGAHYGSNAASDLSSTGGHAIAAPQHYNNRNGNMELNSASGRPDRAFVDVGSVMSDDEQEEEWGKRRTGV